MRWKQVNGQTVQNDHFYGLPKVVEQNCEKLFDLLSSHQPAYHVYNDCVELLREEFVQTLEDLEYGNYFVEFELKTNNCTWVLAVKIGENATSSVECRAVL
jgi:hypothetical protein